MSGSVAKLRTASISGLLIPPGKRQGYVDPNGERQYDQRACSTGVHFRRRLDVPSGNACSFEELGWRRFLLHRERASRGELSIKTAQQTNAQAISLRQMLGEWCLETGFASRRGRL